MSISVIIPSYKRPSLLALSAGEFARQLSTEDEIVIIIHSHDPFKKEYEDLTKRISRVVRVRLVVNPSGNLCHSYNLGLKAASNDIVLFSDDDCIPDKRLIENHMEVYKDFDGILGVTGRITPALLSKSKLVPISNRPALPIFRPWSKPVAGMEGWFFFVTQGGGLSTIGDTEYWQTRGLKLLHSLPIGGGNMSFARKYMNNVFIDEDLVKAYRFEQFLFLKIWKPVILKANSRIHRYVLNLDANTFHIQNVEQTTSRSRSIGDSIRLSAESVKSCFRFKLLLPDRIFLRTLIFEQSIHSLNLMVYSVRLYLKKPQAELQTSLQCVGESIGSIIGLPKGILFYLRSKHLDADYEPAHFSKTVKRNVL
jgi:glycosyltransferase involved in cell wall biosynthesis